MASGDQDQIFGNLPPQRKPWPAYDPNNPYPPSPMDAPAPLTSADIVAGKSPFGNQSLTQYNDPTFSGQLGQAAEQGAEKLGAPMSVQRAAGDVGSAVGGATGLDMPQHISDAINYIRNGAWGQAAGSALAAVPVIPGAAGAKAAQGAAEEAATGSKLFDYSGLNKVPDVPQFDLPRYNPPRGVPARIGDLTANPDVRQGMLDTIQRGVDMGGADWYNADPLRQHFISELGQDAGSQRFQQYMDMVAATSPRSDVGTNVRNASYYYNRLVNDQGMPAVGDINPQPYGHMAQRLHQMNAERVAGAGWDPLNNPKPASFAQDLTGNQQPVAVDTHAFRLPGMLAQDPRFLETAYQSSKDAPKQNIQQMVNSGQMSMEDALKQPAYWQAQPKANEYGAMEQYYQGLAKDQGLSPAQAQAAAWVGGGQTTGLASDASKPFIGFVEDRANKTANARGLSPAEALSQFIRGKAPLLGVGAAGAATAPLWQQYQQSQGRGYGQPSA